jgi:DNA-binding transcriptional LysR family regulator
MTRSARETTAASLDLNLLVSLDALLAERSVSRAAGRLGLSQPTLSAALARLRRHFGDELLTRVGNRYELTPLAAHLAEQVPGALAGVRRVFASEADFDPAAADREFTVLTSDYAVTILGPRLTALLLAQAPGVRLRLHQLSTRHVDAAAETLRTADGIMMPHGFLADLPSQRLFTDRWVGVVAAGNPAVGDELTIAQLEQLPMIVTYRGPTAYTPAGKQLSMLGIRPRVPVVAETFLTVPFLVAATNGVAIIQERLARQLGPAAGVRVVGCPFEAVPLVEALWWHPIHRRDAGHRWLRKLFAEAARQLPELPG